MITAALPQCSQCLRGEFFRAFIHHGGTEDTEDYGSKLGHYLI